MDQMPLVSVCCITYNHEKYIKDAIEGFLMQKTSFPIEIIIHDDASTDGTADIIREYEKRFPEFIKPIYQQENQWSKGIKPSPTYVWPKARGKYIALCEGDDYWTDPLKLQKQVDFLEKSDNYIMCFHKVVIRNERINPISETIQTIDFKNINIDLKFMLTIWSIATASIVFRVPEKFLIPPWFKNVGSADIALAGILYKFGKIGYIDDVMSVYRLNTGISLLHKGKYMVKQRIYLYKKLNHYHNFKYANDIKYAIYYIKKNYLPNSYQYRILNIFVSFKKIVTGFIIK